MSNKINLIIRQIKYPKDSVYYLGCRMFPVKIFPESTLIFLWLLLFVLNSNSLTSAALPRDFGITLFVEPEPTSLDLFLEYRFFCGLEVTQTSGNRWSCKHRMTKLQ